MQNGRDLDACGTEGEGQTGPTKMGETTGGDTAKKAGGGDGQAGWRGAVTGPLRGMADGGVYATTYTEREFNSWQ